MAELSGLLLVVVILALLFDFSNGWHDSANAIATVVSTRVVSPSIAVLVAGGLNVAGAFMSTAVAKMVGTGIVDPQSVTQTVVASALAGAIVWNFMTLLLGLPTSSSHALIGGLVGAALFFTLLFGFDLPFGWSFAIAVIPVGLHLGRRLIHLLRD